MAPRYELIYRPVIGRPARVLRVHDDGVMYASRHSRIYSSVDGGLSWHSLATIPRRPRYRLAEFSRLACRLLRHEIKALAVLTDGTLVAADRTGVYQSAPGTKVMSRASIEEFAPLGKPPMSLTVGPNDRVLWGEYNSRTDHGLPVRVYVSDDHGRSFQVAHVFSGGEILHVHSLYYDRVARCYWLLAGDHRTQPGIGRFSEDLKDFHWVAKGEQRFRAVEVFDLGDSFVYGTDSESERNAILRFDKKTGRTDRLQELEGSCIYACRFGSWYVLSTTVEPSRANACREAILWVSQNTKH